MAEHARKTDESGRQNVVAVSPRSGEDLRSPPSRNSMRTVVHMSSPSPSHRHSFSDQLRGLPASPRSSRQFSLSHGASVQDLWNNPPTAGGADPAFVGRDWHGITVGELIDPDDLRFVEIETGIEDATNVSRTRLQDSAHRSADNCSSFSLILVPLYY